MPLKTPKVASTRLSLPLGVAGSEPDDAAVGTLAYATDSDTVRVKTAAGWVDVGSGGGGSITQVDGTNGIVSTNPTGPVVTLEPDYGSTANTVTEGNDPRLSDSRPPNGAASGDLAGSYPSPTVAAIHETAGPTKLTIGAIATGQVLVRSGTTVVGQTGAAPSGSAGGDLAGTFPNPEVAAIHETSGPTKLTLGSITNGQLLVRSGTTVVGQTGAAPTGSAGGDLAGSYPNPSVAKLTTTTGPTSLTIGAIADGQALVRSGSTVVGQTLATLIDRPGWPYLAKPATPDAWNVEAREMTSADLATNGLTITALLTPWTTFTRAGDIDLSTNPSANTYRSTLNSGILLVQLPLSTPVVVSKATNNNAFTYSCRFWTTDRATSSAASGGATDFGLADNNHRDATGARTYYVGSEVLNYLEFLLVGPSTFTSFTNLGYNGTPTGALNYDMVHLIHNTASGGIMGGNMRNSTSGNLQLGGTPVYFTNRTVSITVTQAVMWWQIINRGALIHFDFMRRLPLNAFG